MGRREWGGWVSCIQLCVVATRVIRLAVLDVAQRVQIIINS